MTTLREAAQQALEALEKEPADYADWTRTMKAARATLRTALAEQPAEQQQEPVAWMCSNTKLLHKGYQMFSATRGGDWNIPVYTAPQPAKQPLTNLEGLKLAYNHHWINNLSLRDAFLQGIRDAEAAHGITKE